MYFYYFLFILTINFVSIKNKTTDERTCCFTTNFAFKNNQRITLKNFDSLDQLEFNCSKPIEMSILEIKPNQDIIFDNRFNFTGLTIKPMEQIFLITFYNFKGFDIQHNPFANLKFFKKEISFWFAIEDSNFDFYLSESLIHDSAICNQKLQVNRFLSQIRILDIKSLTKLSDAMCPYVFKNVLLNVFNVKKITDNFLFRNLLKFQNLTLKKDLNSSIFQAQFHFYHVDLDSTLLNKHVFHNLTVLDLNGVIRSIEDDLFKSFSNLKILRLRTQNIKSLFVFNNKWLNHLNSRVLIDTNNQTDLGTNVFK